MLFNSIDFAVFLPLVFLVYWFPLRRTRRGQNAFLLLASYIFYGWWSWRFLALIFISSAVDFLVGISLSRCSRPKTRISLLIVSLTANLGMLVTFKYADFFVESLADAFSLFGRPVSLRGLDIVLPVGISFYTFQTMSYTIDVFRRRIQPTLDPIEFFAFVSFFPQLVAGPIERAGHLVPQFQRERTFEYSKAVDGLRQILWGLFKKVVVADSAARTISLIFEGDESLRGSTLVLGAVLFSFQIYGDFSGYSDIAIGVARLLGFDLNRNFAFPYFSRDIAEFWRRWHISLSTWFRDYVYIPLGGSRVPRWKQIRNTFIVFLVSGLWHGANWTFVVWGALNALYFLPLLLRDRHRDFMEPIRPGRALPSFSDAMRILKTYCLTCIGWIFFRSEDVGSAMNYLGRMLSPADLLTIPEFLPTTALLASGVMVAVEWVQRERSHGLSLETSGIPGPLRALIYYGLVGSILLLGGSQQQFIYFQF